jgi:dienelactone hydrolase
MSRSTAFPGVARSDSKRRLVPVVVAVFAVLPLVDSAFALDGPSDNDRTRVRPIPPLGIDVPAEDRERLEGQVGDLRTRIAALRATGDAAVIDLLVDIEIFAVAVERALEGNEFWAPREIETAGRLLELGRERASKLEQRDPDWTRGSGLTVRGYVSRIDESVQPYGLVVPSTISASAQPRRLDIWFHGRGEKLSELAFIADRLANPGTFTPENTIVLHPYGRYCNAFKFAGEIDVLEALDSVRSRYAIDRDRIAVRGFSMGGAACWQFAVHYPGHWVAANPGAGFAETPEFLRVFQKEELQPEPWERALWHLYDCTDWASNLIHCPTVAYSGELDAQKQAADIMAQALRGEGLDLKHIIGPKTAHSYHPVARLEVDEIVRSIAEQGRERAPASIRFTTWTLRYPSLAWMRITGLEQHWERARVDARVENRSELLIQTSNVTGLELDFAPGSAPFDPTTDVAVAIDDARLEGPRPTTDRAWSLRLRKNEGAWEIGSLDEHRERPRKRPGLQGPIDDAFLDRFIFVTPTSACAHPEIDAWVKSELDRARTRWRRQFRGRVIEKRDVDVTEDDLRASNVVVWGDRAANSLLARIADGLPLVWGTEGIQLRDETLDAEHHVPILIAPNPLAPDRYVVVNSGFTYREYDDLNNARQVPRLPDWAVVDVRTPPGPRYPGKIVAAGFFDENWQLPR